MVRRHMQTHGYIDPHRINSAYDSNTVAASVINNTNGSSSSSSSGGGGGSNIEGSNSGNSTSTSTSTSAQARSHHPSHHPAARPGIGHTIAEIFDRNGVRGFFKGIMLNVIKGPITLGISFTVYDVAKHHIETFYQLK